MINSERLHYFSRRIIILFITTGLLTSSCKKSSSTNDEYYIKYEVNSSTIYTGRKLNVVFKNETNQDVNLDINTKSPWEITVGPVKKGFSGNMSVSEIVSNYGQLTLQSQISVSKNGSAFATKQIDNSNTPRTSLQISYTIDY